jgi:sodium transport system permease protein
LQFTGWLAVTPLVNIVLLSRDVLEGAVDTPLAIAAVCSTALYIAAAIALAARIFGTDAILYGSQSTWSDIFERPTELQPAATMPAAMFCLALMFPTCFLLAGNLSQMREFTMSQRLVGNALITVLVFGGIPALLALFGRVRWSSGFGMRSATIWQFLACAVLGLSLWPVAHELFLLGKWLGIATLSRERLDLAKSILEQWKGLSPALILVVMAVVPGVFEEFCFRGYLFGALRSVLSAAQTIVISALLFGLFHEVLAPGRLLPSAFMGFVLGWVRWRTGSVLPCMLLHVLHDGLLISVILWREQLTDFGIGADEAEHLPTTWLAMAAVAIAGGVMMLVAATRGTRGEMRVASEVA